MELQQAGIDSENGPCSAARMAKRAAKSAPLVQADTLQVDVITVCERIQEIAKTEFRWDLERLAKEARHPFQSFVNWKKGHQLPKIAYLQDFARAVGANVRLLIQDADHPGGLGMASNQSRQIAALIDARLKGDENEEARKQVVELVKHYLGTLPHP